MLVDKITTSSIWSDYKFTVRPFVIPALKNDSVSFENSKHISIAGKNYKDKIKIIFTDIDGTISPHSDIMSEKTISSINALHSHNIPLILTTARCYEDTLPVIKQFEHNPDYKIGRAHV